MPTEAPEKVQTVQPAPLPGAPRPPHTTAPMMPPPTEETPGLGAASVWGAKIWREVKRLGRRVFVHLSSSVCAVATAVSFGSFMAGTCVYVGGVCLAARDISLTPHWLVPALTGLAQTILFAATGYGFPAAMFWGGAQAWLQRLVFQRGRMGSEWGMLVLLLPTAIFLLDTLSLSGFLLPFGVLFVAGAGIAHVFLKRDAARIRAELLEKTGPPEPERVARYRASLAEFSRKVALLPEDTRGAGQSLAASTQGILHSMATDSRDLEPGHRFLNRYFTAAHSVVVTHLSLANERLTPEIAVALVKSSSMLARLDEAFIKEHERLLQNDVTDFSADLAVIDTLLKMDGR